MPIALSQSVIERALLLGQIIFQVITLNLQAVNLRLEGVHGPASDARGLWAKDLKKLPERLFARIL